LPAEDVIEPCTLCFDELAVRIVIRCRYPAETCVVVASEALEEGIALGDRGHLCEAQFLHEAVLQRAVGALDATFSQRGVRADALNVQIMQRRPNCVMPSPRVAPALLTRNTACLPLRDLHVLEGRLGLAKWGTCVLF
jgi:hypothetical protein